MATAEKPLHDQIPNVETVGRAGDVQIVDHDNGEHSFKSLYSKPGRHLIVFIRHYFCGSCEDFVRALSQGFQPENLQSDFNLSSIALIGCGESSQIPGYVERTSCPFPIYSNPDRSLYRIFGMDESLAMGPRPDYVKSGVAAAVVKSMTNALKAGWKASAEGGNYSQIGGEILYQTGTDGNSEVTWCHRMQNTRDHTEIKDLQSILHAQA